MLTYIIIIGIILVAFFLIVVVYPVLAKKFSPGLKQLNGQYGLKGFGFSAKWKDELNRVAKATESESSLPYKNITTQPPASPSSQEERIKQLEEQVANLNKCLLGAATVAASTAAQILEPERLKFFQSIRNQAYNELKLSQPDSNIIATTSSFVTDCIKVGEYENLEMIDKKPKDEKGNK